MAGAQPSGPLTAWYERRIGVATTDDEIYGYWLFLAGVIAGVLGMIGFFVTDAATTSRGVAYALLGLAPVVIVLGAVIRFPLRRAATALASVGAAISVLSLAWFLVIFPEGWSLTFGDTGVIVGYSVGLLILGIAGAFVPLLTDPLRAEHEQLLRETAAADTKSEQERETNDRRHREHEEEVEGLRAAADAVQISQARFEVYQDETGGYRWRLRHQNGNVIADSNQAYSQQKNVEKGMESVRRNALGAGTLDVDEYDGDEPEDADHPAAEIPAETEDTEGQATFELYEDNGGEYRWRLRHRNGNILADSAEGYSSKSNAQRALNRLREHVALAESS